MSLWWEGTGVFHHRFAQLVKRASNKGRGTTVYPIHTSLMPVPAGDAQSLERDHTDQQQSTWRTGQSCQVRKVRKVNALIELKLIRDIRGHQGQQGKLIYVWWYGGERKIRGRVGPLWKEMGDFFTWDLEKAEVFNDISASVFTDKYANHEPRCLSCRKEKYVLGEWGTTCSRNRFETAYRT